MKILFKLATRSRRLKATNSIKNIIDNCASDNFVILVSADYDDEEMKNFNHCDKHVIISYGTSESKIHAVNRDIELIKDWDILVNTSDDMLFTVKGFDDIIRQDFMSGLACTLDRILYKDSTYNLDQFIHYNDGNQKDNVCTMSIMGREYYNRFDYVYHPSYKSLWCDCEATEAAYMLGKYKYMGDDKIIFRHLHPAWGLAEYDEQYRKTEHQSMWDHDKDVITLRRSESYGLEKHLIINPFKYESL